MSRREYRKQMRGVADRARMLAGWIDEALQNKSRGPTLCHLQELVEMFKEAERALDLAAEAVKDATKGVIHNGPDE